MLFSVIYMNNLFSLKGKKVVLTGAAGFFGTYFAEALLSAEADKVFCVDVSEPGLADLKKRLGASSSKQVEYVVLDQGDQKMVAKVFGKLAEHGVDVLINNSFVFGAPTGFAPARGRIEDATFEQLQKSFESGIYWSIQATQIFAEASKKSDKPLSVINLGSMYSVVVPSPTLYEGFDYYNPPGYSMAKTGLVAFTKYTAAWMGPLVRANILCPGAIPNDEKKSANSEQNKNDAFRQRMIDRTALKRLGHPNDLVGTVVFLASDASSYITGQMIVVDGGWTIV